MIYLRNFEEKYNLTNIFSGLILGILSLFLKPPYSVIFFLLSSIILINSKRTSKHFVGELLESGKFKVSGSAVVMTKDGEIKDKKEW